MEFRDLASETTRQPTWYEAEVLSAMSAAGIADVYIEVEDAERAFWQSLVLASDAHLLPRKAESKYWRPWIKAFQWAQALPDPWVQNVKEVYEEVVVRG